jgi:hypothetical protein
VKALLYLKATGVVFAGVSASLEADLYLHETDTVGVLISDMEWRDASVDVSNPANPHAILKEPE